MLGALRAEERGPSEPRPTEFRAGGGDVALARMLAAEMEHPGQMIPVAIRTHLDHVTGELLVLARKLGELRGLGDAAPVGWQSSPEHVAHVNERMLFADRTEIIGGMTDILGRPDELRMSVAHVASGQPTPVVLVDEMPPGQSVIDSGRAAQRATNRTGPEGHKSKG